jgi:hypothetical protein
VVEPVVVTDPPVAALPPEPVAAVDEAPLLVEVEEELAPPAPALSKAVASISPPQLQSQARAAVESHGASVETLTKRWIMATEPSL